MKILHKRLNSPVTTILNPNSAPAASKGVFYQFIKFPLQTFFYVETIKYCFTCASVFLM